MPKTVVEVIEVYKTLYYVDVPVPEWAGDAQVMGELEPFSSELLSEAITSISAVSAWPVPGPRASVNAAGNVWNPETQQYDQVAAWDLVR